MINPDNMLVCPYVGLQPFTEEHRPFFFGRERDQRVIVTNIVAVPLTILYGPSGVGKSSVLFAGVVPQLRERSGCAVVVFRDWQETGFLMQFKNTCISAVALSDDTDAGELKSLALDDLLYQLATTSNKSICVIFDQFEEYFFYHPCGPVSDIFETEFARAINREEVEVNFLVALREDSLHKLDRFRARIRNLLGNTLRLEQLERESAERAIKGPLEVYNRQFSSQFAIEDELVWEVLDQTRARLGVAGLSSDVDTHENRKPAQKETIERIETPFLQLVMERLWEEEMEKSSLLRLSTFQRLGGAKEIARTHLERKLENLEPEEKTVCVEFFDRLVTPSGTKVACRLDDLIQWAGNLSERVPGILKRLEGGRILRRIEALSGSKDAPPLYEVFHDVLGGAILEWRKQYLKEQEIAEATRQAEKGRRQAEAEAVRVEQERAKEARNVAKFKTLSAALALAFVALAAAFSLVIMLFRSSSEATRKASLQERIERAKNFLDTDPERSGMLARDVLKEAGEFRDVEREATDALSRALTVSALRSNFSMRNTPILAEAYAPEQDMLATLSDDGTVRLWDAKSGSLHDAKPGSLWSPSRGPGRLQLPGGGAKYSTALASFGSQGNLLAVAVDQGDRCDAYVWNVNFGSIVGSLPGVARLAFGPNDYLATTDSVGRSVEVWNTSTWKLEKSIPFKEELDLGVVWSIAFDPTNRKIATAHQNGDVMLLDSNTGSLQRLRGTEAGHAHDATVQYVAFSRDGKLLGSASADKTVKLWNADTGELQRTLAGHAAEVIFLEFSPDGTQVVTCSKDYDARIWDAQTGKLLRTLSGHTNSVFKARFSPSGKLVASASADGSVRLWEVATGRFLFGLKGHNGPVEELVFSEDGNTVYTLGRDGTVRAWTISTEHTGPVNQVLFSETGSLATAGDDGTVKLWDPFGGDVLQIFTGHQQAVEAVAFTSDGMSLATASRDHSVKIWDTVTGKKTATLQGHVDAVNDLAFDPTDKSVLTTAGLDGRVLLWEGTKEVELGKHEWQALHVAFSPDGSRIASGGSNGDAFIWGVKAKGKIATLHDPNFGGILKAHRMAIWRIAFSPNGDFVLTCSEDKTAKIWRASDGHLVSSFNEHAGVVTDGQFNPQDGRTVVTASLDNTAKIWEVSSGKLLQNLTGHTQPVIAAIFDRTGTLIATASWDGTTKIWQKNQEEGLFKEVLTLTSSGQVGSVDFSPDGKRIAIGSSTGEVTIFPFDREALMNLANRRFTSP